MNTKQQANCDAWIEVFRNLGTNGVPSLAHLETITSPDVRFRDPFNDLTGRPAIQKLLEHTVSQIRNVRFEICDSAASSNRIYLKWEMTGELRVLGAWQVRGMSELLFDAEGKILLHQDYWDASEQFLARLPVIGWLVRRIRSVAAVS